MKLLPAIFSILFAVLVMSGCQTYDPYTGEKQVSKATTIGAISAVVCGAIGSRKSSKRARNAAVGCGLIGMGVGAYMDAQEKKLRNELEGTGVRVAREGENIRLIMPSNITFGVNRAEVQSSFYSTLNSVAKVLGEFNESVLVVSGHTDSSGSESYNFDLSIKRATSVANYLKQREISSERLKVRGFGESSPIATNSTEQGRADNRRVELLIEPKAQN
ncbi:OmpA family protein [Pleionea mediterranea]|jgi:outer membrane protein OmpA-like peptidoglycan-associated protein|uniref:Outer membrane protein OmpA-like peptidoglycan-associated protein n=1 Tax=Pleionea mediterranea TaxID=523701 RepID=A0A316GFJ7_9GAMM|nr:OmpA family protein [Pleionea mediterranea]PWK53467.1 outer membrane protein OmpA-like peptidoglycan-associated protein [Pleionea mediterranea]